MSCGSARRSGSRRYADTATSTLPRRSARRPAHAPDRLAGRFADHYAAWVWLTTPWPSLHGATPLALLVRGEAGPVARAAQGRPAGRLCVTGTPKVRSSGALTEGPRHAAFGGEGRPKERSQPIEGKLLLTESEAADFLSFKSVTLSRYRFSGDGPAYCKLGGAMRYYRADLLAWAWAKRRGHPRERR